MRSKTVLITGAAAGIGYATAAQVLSRGGRAIVIDREADAARQAGEQLVADHVHTADGSVFTFGCDVSCEQQVEELFSRLQCRGLVADGLVATAGVDICGLAHELGTGDWQRVIDVNLTGSFLVARSVLRQLVRLGRPGSLVLCSSPAALVGFAAGGATAYSASKGGVSAMVRTLAVDYARHGIRVNAIMPGPTETKLMWASVPEEQLDAKRHQIASEVPLGRLASPDEPARAALWLLSDDSSYVTGSHLVCDGGVLAKASISI